MIYAFQGYLWILFSERIVSYANVMSNRLMGAALVVGTLVFMDVVHRIAPFLKKSLPTLLN
ncbi:hypothetical protein SAMN04488689_11382 [Paenibacillus sp. cl6col]|nr:hypothetical protein SAMN04488689_11382 [Paenibacillus sp. cl6col]